MTIKELGRAQQLQRARRAMTIDAILNMLLISYFGDPLEILAVEQRRLHARARVRADRRSCCCARTGRTGRGRSSWPASGCRSPRCCSLINFAFLVFGGFIYSGGFLGIDRLRLRLGQDPHRPARAAVGLLLYVWRHVVQDKNRLQLREEMPEMPPEERPRAPAPVRGLGPRRGLVRRAAPSAAELRDGPRGSACGGAGRRKTNQSIIASGSRKKTREDVAGEREEHRERRPRSAEDHRQRRGSAAGSCGSRRTARRGSGPCPSAGRRSRRPSASP